METPIGPLTPYDEGLGHQIVDTFAVTGSSDLAWTEKVCAMAMARDGHLQLGFGLGRYTTEEEIDFVADLVIDKVNHLRNMSPLYEMFKDGIDLKSVAWVAH